MWVLLCRLTTQWHTPSQGPSILIKRVNMTADVAPPSAGGLTAKQAMAKLGVSRQTLYAYVSRSRIAAVAAPDDPRRSMYAAADVGRLADRNRRGRSRR